MTHSKNKKRKVLIIAHHLTVGGSQKSLLTTLPLINYEENDVTLYIRKNRIDLIGDIDKRVNVIVNQDNTHYYRLPKSICYLTLIKLFELIKLGEEARSLTSALDRYIQNKQRKNELKSYFQGKEYDTAISFFQGFTIDILANGIIAKRKYAFYRASTDEHHDFHEKAFKNLDGIIVVAEPLKRILSSFYPEERDKIQVIDNYVDADEIWEKAGKYDVMTDNSSTLICSCGRLASAKGFDLAVEAAQIISDKGFSFNWIFIGDGPDRQMLETMAADAGVDAYIRFVGMQDNPYPWIKACDIYVQPSREESYGRTIKEALILERPIVSTSTEGGKYVLQGGQLGWLTPIDANGLAEQIMELLNDRSLIEQKRHKYTIMDNYKERAQYSAKINDLMAGIL